MASEHDFSVNLERFTGFADVYDRFRPSPPEALAELLIRLAGSPRLLRVADLGCGTGLSSRYWSGQAAEVIGIEPTDAMRRQAEARGGQGVSYRNGFSHATGLPDGAVQLVTCSQSLHWMDPQPTFEEAGRILAPGGVFAAYDYDWPPVTGVWEVDAVYQACEQRCRALEKEARVSEGLRFWEKSGHLERMAASGVFRWTREVLLHHRDDGTAERLVGLFYSQGLVQSLRKAGFSEDELGITRLREVAEAGLGPAPQGWWWCSRIKVGVV